MDKGLRYNEGKTRLDLVGPFAAEQLGIVATLGAQKYAPRNWELGMKWSKVIASLKRHLNAIERGEDYDQETNQLHSAHVMWNAMALTEYYKIYPQGDDRPHAYLNLPKIGLDIDEVLADWMGGYKERYGYPEEHEFNSWHVSYDIWDRIGVENVGENFYSNLKVKTKPEDIPFEPHCYITTRNVDTKITEEWLYRNGFPCVPVYTVGKGNSKVEIAKEVGVEWFVDDVYKNFLELNRAGICCFLFDAPHNRRFNVGHKRIYSLKDLMLR
jgi:hypothetical protein